MDSTQGKSENAAIILHDFLTNFGLNTKIDNYKEGEANVETRIGPKGAPSIIVSGHLDTVPFGDLKNWEHHPLSGKIVDGELWGRGSVDMKGGVACLAGVMLELMKHESDLNHQIIFAATAEEETGLLGAKQFVSQGIMKNATHLLITEPTGLDVEIMEKGVLWFDILAKGKQAHGARPDLGHNAIEGLAKIMPEIYTLLPDDEVKEVGKTTINFGMIGGGTAPNVVPENATLTCDIRTVPGLKNQQILDKIENLLLAKSDQNIQFIYDLKMSDEAVISKDRKFGNKLAHEVQKHTGKLPELGGAYYATDGAAFMEEKEVSFAIFGPGSKEMLHQTNERLDLEQLDIAGKVIRYTILDITGKSID